MYIYHFPVQATMRNSISLDGIVLRSVDMDKTRNFYQALLNTEFKREQHESGPAHYAARPEMFPLLEIYPCKKAVNPPSPILTFRALRQSIINERIRHFLPQEMKQLDYNQWQFPDPDGRMICLVQDKKAEEYIEFKSVGLLCNHLDAAKEFYGSLFGEEALVCKETALSSTGKAIRVKYFFSPAGSSPYKLELHSSDALVVPASPSLLFQVHDLDHFIDKFGERVQEKKESPHLRQITLYDTDGRKVYLHQAVPEPSWLDRLGQYLESKRQD